MVSLAGFLNHQPGFLKRDVHWKVGFFHIKSVGLCQKALPMACTHDGSMGRGGIFTYIFTGDFYGFHVGKYTIGLMDPIWDGHTPSDFHFSKTTFFENMTRTAGHDQSCKSPQILASWTNGTSKIGSRQTGTRIKVAKDPCGESEVKTFFLLVQFTLGFLQRIHVDLCNFVCFVNFPAEKGSWKHM